MGGKPTDHTGKKFGKLIAVEFVGSTPGNGKAQWLCQCDCGNTKVCKAENLIRGKSKSCGCDFHENRVKQVTKHGHTRMDGYASRTYRTWHSMKQRCQNSNTAQFYDYGGRGIKVCEEWNDFRNFLADMGEKPKDKSLDRIDVDGDYEPGNCRWATASEQALNKRPRMTHQGVRKLIDAAMDVVAANDNDVQPAIDRLEVAIKSVRSA